MDFGDLQAALDGFYSQLEYEDHQEWNRTLSVVSALTGRHIRYEDLKREADLLRDRERKGVSAEAADSEWTDFVDECKTIWGIAEA